MFQIFLRVTLTVLSATAVMATSLVAQEETEKKSFFLPSSPVGAAYVLGRLSNKELSEAPRGEFVYVALLQRKGMERKFRIEALDGLAKIRNTDPLTELLRGLSDLDRKGSASEDVLLELQPILLSSQPAVLRTKRDALARLAEESQVALTRQIAFAALVTADGSVTQVWPAVESSPEKLADLLMGIRFLREANLRAAFYPSVKPLLHRADPVEVRRAAITAIAAIPGHDEETFAVLAGLVRTGVERNVAVAALQKIPRTSWPKEQAEPLTASLLAYLQAVPVEQRTEAEVVNALQLASDLAGLLPPEKAGLIGKSLRALGVSVFVIRTIPEQMQYDRTLIVVGAGKPVSLVLINDDAMPHNLVVTTPGALEEIGPLAESMPPETDARGRLYVPTSPKVLHATKLVEPGKQTRLSFTAPEEVGDYEYVCTFPGHWRLMRGRLVVTDDVEAYLVKHAASAQPKITEWKIADLTPQFARFDSGRSLARGKEAFTKLACASCHKLGSDGVNYGPELTDVFPRYANDPAAVAQQILEPSLLVSNRYRGFEFELKDGEELAGLIVKEEGETLTVQTGPAASLIRVLKSADILTKRPQRSSLMPVGLFNTLSAEEILDLLAYMKSAGSLPAHHHQH